MCVAGPLGSFGQQEANARPDAWQAAARQLGSGSSVRAFFSSVSCLSMAEVATSLDLRGTDAVASMAWKRSTLPPRRRGPKRPKIEKETTHAIGRRRRRAVRLGRRFKRVGVGDRETGSQNFKRSSSTLVVRCRDMSPK